MIFAQRRWFTFGLCAAVAIIGVLEVANAQEPAKSTIWLTPTFAAGGSVLEYDYAGDRPFRGLALRAGVEFTDVFDLVLTGEHWAHLGTEPGWSALVEAAYWPVGRQLLAPYLLFGLGRFDNTPVNPAGTSQAVGLGLAGRIARPVTLRLEGLVRIDAGAGNDQLRAFVGLTPWRPVSRRLRGRRHAQFTTLAMLPLSGPWRFVEPGYEVRFATELLGRHSAGVAIALLHWQMRDPSRIGGYSWDTRAVLLMPEWRYRLLGSSTAFTAHGGPLLSVMVEGPDDGFRGGAHVGLTLGQRLGPLLASTGIDLMWLVRNPQPVFDVDPTDQRSALLRLGIGF